MIWNYLSVMDVQFRVIVDGQVVTNSTTGIMTISMHRLGDVPFTVEAFNEFGMVSNGSQVRVVCKSVHPVVWDIQSNALGVLKSMPLTGTRVLATEDVKITLAVMTDQTGLLHFFFFY